MQRRSRWSTDVVIVMIFAAILAVLSVVNVATLQQSYDQTERIQTVNRFVDCLDPTTRCGARLAEYRATEREFFTKTMRVQAVCTLLTSRTLRGTDNPAELERVYNDCVRDRAAPPPKPPESPVVENGED